MEVLSVSRAGEKGTKKLHEKGGHTMSFGEKLKTEAAAPAPQRARWGRLLWAERSWEDLTPEVWILTAVPQRHLVSSQENRCSLTPQSWALDRNPKHLLRTRKKISIYTNV